jgi:uncharacterized membrane protein YdbT with pleckstrin-like domain
LLYNLNMIVHQSYVFLILKLIAIEILTLFLYLLIRLPKTIIILPNSSVSENISLNYITIIYFFILSLIQIIFTLKITLEWANNNYEIRDDSIIHRQGIFKIKEDIYTLRNLSSVTIEQSIWGKLFNYGTIILYSPIHKTNYYLINVQNPKKIIQTFYDNIEDTKKSEIIRKKF